MKKYEKWKCRFKWKREKHIKSFFSSRRCQVTGLNGVTFLDRTRMVADPPGSPPQAPAYQVVQGCIFSWKIILLENNWFSPIVRLNFWRGNKYFVVWNKYLCNKYEKGWINLSPIFYFSPRSSSHSRTPPLGFLPLTLLKDCTRNISVMQNISLAGFIANSSFNWKINGLSCKNQI